MLKWARERVRMLMLHQAGHENPIVAAGSDVASSSMIKDAAQRATKRLVAISSAGFDPMAVRELLRTPVYTPTRTVASPRRPGVHARWKEQNRVPFQNVM